MVTTPGIMTIPSKIIAPAVFAQGGYATDETNASLYNFNTVSINSATSDRYVFVCSQMDRNAAGTTATLTCNGVSMNNLINVVAAGTGQLMQWYSLLVTSGTTANFALTVNAACNRAAIWIVTATGLLNAGAASATYNTSGGNPGTFSSVNVTNGGFALWGCSIQNAAGSPIGWSGNVSGNYGTNLEGTTSTYMSVAYTNTVVSGGSVTCTPAAAGQSCGAGISVR